MDTTTVITTVSWVKCFVIHRPQNAESAKITALTGEVDRLRPVLGEATGTLDRWPQVRLPASLQRFRDPVKATERSAGSGFGGPQ